MNQEQRRRAAQLAFVESGKEIELGQSSLLPMSADALAAVSAGNALVVEEYPGGLTAEVWRLRAGGRDWTLKKARTPCLVQNVDGQTSFLNEIQRRADILELKARSDAAEAFNGLADTTWASFRRGLMLSPWIDGGRVLEWTEPRLIQLFELLEELLMAGLFEWDLCPGNILDDSRIRLFDFGYMYRFDPLCEFNSNGLDAPLFHAAERFETRNYFAYLLEQEKQSQDQALAAFVMEKRIAIECYERLIYRLRKRHASTTVLAWLEGFVQRWKKALGEDPGALYLAEGWRSHRLDLDDDLRGQTCTPRTLARATWLLDIARRDYATLRQLDALFWHDRKLSQAQLVHTLEEDLLKAQRWQVGG